MKYIVSDNEMSRIDDYTINEVGIPALVLMERAAYEVFSYIKDNFSGTSNVLVVVEGGNNGGDGLAIARMLYNAGYSVCIHWINCVKCISDSFKTELSIVEKLGISFTDEIMDSGYDIVVDAVFGTGLRRAVTGKHAEVIRLMNEIEAFKIAVDIPSGIHTHTGFVLGTAFKADLTVTFGFMKLGMLMGIGCEYSGKTIVADIGFPEVAVDSVQPHLFSYDRTELKELLPRRKSDSHKGSYGKVGVIAGSHNMAGAAIFAAEAAYRMGCGMVRVCTVYENREIIQTTLPEALLTTYEDEDIDSAREALKQMMEWSDVIVIGPGIGMGASARYLVEKLIRKYSKSIVVDADAINILSDNTDWLSNSEAQIIVTPHLMEMSRLSGEKTGSIKENKYEIAKAFSKKYGVVTVLKDARTIVSDGSSEAYINITGDNGMATAGSGDVLTGIIAGLLAQHMSCYDAATLGVFIHGLSGEAASERMGEYGVIARDIINNIRTILDKIENGEYKGI